MKYLLFGKKIVVLEQLFNCLRSDFSVGGLGFLASSLQMMAV